MILFKGIKPRKLNDKAMLKKLLDEAISIANDIELDFGLTVGTWERDVEFRKIISIEKKGIAIFVGSDDEIYGYVSGGTKPHIILPVNAAALAFKSGYRAKTVVGQAVARQGGAFGPTIFSAGVIHPGNEPREFEKLIHKDWKKRFKRRMEKAMKSAAKVSDNPI